MYQIDWLKGRGKSRQNAVRRAPFLLSVNPGKKCLKHFCFVIQAHLENVGRMPPEGRKIWINPGNFQNFAREKMLAGIEIFVLQRLRRPIFCLGAPAAPQKCLERGACGASKSAWISPKKCLDNRGLNDSKKKNYNFFSLGLS